MDYETFTNVLEQLQHTNGRLKSVEILTTFFSSSSPTDLKIIIHLINGILGPSYNGIELGIAKKSILHCIHTVFSSSYNNNDLGNLAQECRNKTPSTFNSKLSCQDVWSSLHQIASQKGTTNKMNLFMELLLKTRPNTFETKFLVRGIEGKLQCGLAETTILTALAHTFVKKGMTKSNAEKIVRQAYNECPNYDMLIETLCSKPLTQLLSYCHLTPFIPIKPMLSKPENSFKNVLRGKEFVEFVMEYKYDGERAQIHYCRGKPVKIFSRNCEDMTTKYPDVIDIIPKISKLKSFILDGEIVAIDCKTGKLLPFQILSTRKRKNESINDIQVQVIYIVFDILYFNDTSLLEEPLLKRKEILHHHFHSIPKKFEFTTTNHNPQEIEEFLDEAVQHYCEGLMIKTCSSKYEITKRSSDWLKLKKDYLTEKGVADSLDLVVIGANMGQGKRSGVYGSFLLASCETDKCEYQSVCKLGTGFTDDFLSSIKTKLDSCRVNSKPSHFKTNIECDVWFEPLHIWEVKAADITISPIHSNGLSLRFPRFIRERDDKKEITTSLMIHEMYLKQL